MSVQDGKPPDEGKRRCATPGCERPVVAIQWCNRCRQRRDAGLIAEGRPVCEVKGCGNIATTCQGHRCRPHAIPVVRARWEDGPLPTRCFVVCGAGQDRGDYGRAVLPGGKSVAAHRWAWTVGVGPIPEGMCVLHHCDRPGCIALDHLFLGTILDNNADRKAKGGYHAVRGEEHHWWGKRPHHAKLTDDAVRQIRVLLAEGHSQCELARRFKVSHDCVNKLAHGKSYRSVI